MQQSLLTVPYNTGLWHLQQSLLTVPYNTGLWHLQQSLLTVPWNIGLLTPATIFTDCPLKHWIVTSATMSIDCSLKHWIVTPATMSIDCSLKHWHVTPASISTDCPLKHWIVTPATISPQMTCRHCTHIGIQCDRFLMPLHQLIFQPQCHVKYKMLHDLTHNIPHTPNLKHSQPPNPYARSLRFIILWASNITSRIQWTSCLLFHLDLIEGKTSEQLWFVQHYMEMICALIHKSLGYMAGNFSDSWHPEKLISLGWTHHPHGRQQAAEAIDVWGARFWEAKARQASEDIQRLRKASISHAEINPKELEPRAHDRTGWRALTRCTTDIFEERRRTQIKEAWKEKRRRLMLPAILVSFHVALSPDLQV